MEYEYPQLSLLIITSVAQTNKIVPRSYLLFHANIFNGISLLWTLWFFHSKRWASATRQPNATLLPPKDDAHIQYPDNAGPKWTPKIQLRAF